MRIINIPCRTLHIRCTFLIANGKDPLLILSRPRQSSNEQEALRKESAETEYRPSNLGWYTPKREKSAGGLRQSGVSLLHQTLYFIHLSSFIEFQPQTQTQRIDYRSGYAQSSSIIYIHFGTPFYAVYCLPFCFLFGTSGKQPPPP